MIPTLMSVNAYNVLNICMASLFFKPKMKRHIDNEGVAWYPKRENGIKLIRGILRSNMYP
jgi:hypothetical protein